MVVGTRNLFLEPGHCMGRYEMNESKYKGPAEPLGRPLLQGLTAVVTSPRLRDGCCTGYPIEMCI